ncbi:dephospho-CoA kinase [Haematobacter massiliensis]|uniref:Dephospho-CoA kinase n=1 Tax=Haematobacter massiliensis TaxID=195105 RepID=A0A086Y0W7_9RHOB|nr:dephospho-CoA kinase [Haematobacter massiliensis]KFI27917.1 dephospho-CoA kinase [Haematobacter massiliensis]OWJ69983.1 dephospho-CoA kinase [Haematobacter massiliensis]OWJ87132.1 dephospho-CoA kinase [Haematobacter massiliensis]QBJ25218.1 dephospho-CoA kinase [Haematobacter massiliensis]
MTTPFVLGLTGSIGMGKSTTAAFFAEAGIPVWDADAAVHRLYAAGGQGAEAIRSLHPAALVDGAVDRDRLKEWIAEEPHALVQIEAVIHPLVAVDRARFMEQAEAEGADMVVLDIPLLFETGQDIWMDAVAVVTVDPATQRHRVLARGTMTPAQFDAILEKQMPDAQKRGRADYVIETNTLEEARDAVLSLIEQIRKSQHA